MLKFFTFSDEKAAIIYDDQTLQPKFHVDAISGRMLPVGDPDGMLYATCEILLQGHLRDTAPKENTSADHVNALRRAVLMELADLGEEYGASCMWLASSLGTDFEIVRAVIATLKRDGFVELLRGCLNDDGQFSGSAHVITESGKSYLTWKGF